MAYTYRGNHKGPDLFDEPIVKKERQKAADPTKRLGRAKLTADQVREIRASDESKPALALRYGVGITAIRDIRNGTTWGHVA